MKYSNFGKMNYGIFYGELFYDTKNPTGCSDFPGNNFKNYNYTDYSPIVMVDRGNCSFASKSFNIEKAGGEFAFIINHFQNFDDILSIGDDGVNRGNLNITSILIPEVEGEILKNFINRKPDEKIIVQINHIFINENEDEDKLRVNFFFNPSDHKVYKLFEDIRKFEKTLLRERGIKFKFEDNNIILNPIYTFDLMKNSSEYKQFLIKSNRCICKGRYCEDFRITEGRTGKDLLIESIRQKCIYLVTLDSKNISHYFREYFSKYYFQCARNSNYTKICGDDILENLFLKDTDYIIKIERCFKNSFIIDQEFAGLDEVFENCKSNIHLDEQLHFVNYLKRKGLPYIEINNVPFYGSWDINNFFNFICENFNFNKGINSDICKKKDFNESGNEYSNVWKNTLTILIVISAIIFIFICIYFIMCRYCHKKVIENKNRCIENKINYLDLISDNLNKKKENKLNVELIESINEQNNSLNENLDDLSHQIIK